MANGSRSSEAKSYPAWVRWLLPSVADLLFVAMLGLLAFTALSTRLLGDAGIGWHIRTGQIILATHAIPRVDSFSSSLNGHPWFAWEWLYDVIVGWLERVAGLNGVVLLTAFVIAAVLSLTFRLMVRRGATVLAAALLVLIAASAGMIHFLARPHVLSWLFTVVWFEILESSERRSAQGSTRPPSRKLWLLPLLMLVWANVHGGFLVGFVLLAIYWLDAAWRILKPKGDRFEDALRRLEASGHIRALTAAGLLSAAATFINPYGYHLHSHIYGYLSNRFLIDHIDEFQSPNFHLVAQKCFAGLLMLTFVALASRQGTQVRMNLSEGFVLLFAVYSGLYSSRNIPVSSLLLILLIGPWLSKAMGNFSQSRPNAVRERFLKSSQFLSRMKAMELSLRGHLWPILAIVLTCWIAAHGGKLGSTSVMNAHFDDKRFPAAAIDYLEAHNIQGPIFAPDYWGGYFIYRLYPHMKVVIDDRHDFYGQHFLEPYLKMVHAEPGWEEFLSQHPANCVIVPKRSAIANLLAETKGWQAIYSDEVALSFVRVPASP